MYAAKDHQNKLLISITDGKKLGEIKDLYLDGEVNKVAAAFLGAEGLFNRKSFCIERSSIQVYGIDVWLVSGSDKIKELSDVTGSENFLTASDFRGREIQSEGGTLLGTIDDTLLDEEANVIGFSLSKVFVQGPLAERKAIARSAVTDFGSKNSPMTTLLAKAESLTLPSAL